MEISNFSKDYKSIFWLLVLVVSLQIVLSFIVGLRDISIGTDTVRYTDLYEYIKNCHCFDGGVERGFQYYTLFLAWSGMSSELYFFCISITLFLLLNVVSVRLSRVYSGESGNLSNEHWQFVYLIFLIFLLSPFFVSAHINAIRQGLASFMVYYALISLIAKDWKMFVAASVIAGMFHHTAFMYLAFFPIVLMPINLIVSLVIVLSVSYSTGFSEILVSWMSNLLDIGIYDSVSNYQRNVHYTGGIRYDFLIFSLFLGGLSFVVYKFFSIDKYRIGLENLLRVYLVLLIPFLLLGFANFSNRYVYTAWLFLPFLAAATLLAIEQWHKVQKFILPVMTLVSPLIFMVMVVNGFAR